MPNDNLEPFVIEEVNVAQPQRVELSDYSMPFGRPREVVAYNTGGKTDIADDGIYNPSSDRVVLQVMTTTKQRPLVLKGQLRDSQLGGAGNAKALRDQLETLRTRANPLRLTYDGDTFEGLLWETDFPHEGPNDLTYSLTFFIAVGPLGAGTTTSNQSTPSSPIDVTAQIVAQLAEIEAKQFALDLQAAAMLTLTTAWTSVDDATTALASSAQTFDAEQVGTGQQALNSAKALDSAAAQAQAEVQSLRASVAGLRWDAAVSGTDVDSQNSWSSAQAQADSALAAIVDQLRSIRRKANERIRKTSTLYKVAPGDTLESIAQARLGSRARASDLGIAPSDLVAGNYIRIPEAG